MNQKVDLKVDFCSHEAAKWAVEHWHYSKRMPKSKLVYIGAWENNKFIGCVIFGYGATPEIGKPYNLKQTEICELVRVALTSHTSPVSRVLAIAIKFLAKQSPGIRLIVSFSDTGQGHHGGIYQATNWLYVGSEGYHAYRVRGEVVHPRTLYDRYGVGGQSIPWLHKNVDPKAERIETEAKHKYLYPLDRAMRKQIEPLAKPYPKRDNTRLAEGSTPATSQGRRFDPDQAALISQDPIRLSE